MKKKKRKATEHKGKPRKRRRKRNRRGPGLLISFFCMVLICAAILAAVTVFLKVKTVTVVGDTRYDALELAQASQIPVGSNMFFLNKFAARDRIFAGHPYLDEVTIRRRLPDTVEITVTECVPVAAVQTGEGYWLIDAKGKLLENITYDQAVQTCLVTGMEIKEPKVGDYATFSDEEKAKALFTILNTAQNSAILKEIMGIDMQKLFEIKLQYTDRFTVELGTIEDLEKKISFLESVIGKLGSTDVGVIDLTDAQTARFRPE